MAISTKAREKCLAKARKRVIFEQKWGRSFAGFEFILAAACWVGAGFAWYFVVARLAPFFGQNQAVNQGLAIGALLGFWSGLMAFKGALSLCNGIQTLRGDAASHVLVEYHDALESLVREERTDG